MLKKIPAFYSILLIFLFSFSINLQAKSKYPWIRNEILVIQTLKEIYSAQAIFKSTVGNNRFGNRTQLWEANLIDDQLASGTKYGYTFTISETIQYSISRFTIQVVPVKFGRTGRRSFLMSSDCKIHGANKRGQMATVDDPIIETCSPTIAHENESEIIAALRTIYNAQMTYKSTVGNGDFGNLSELYLAELIDQRLASGLYADYSIAMIKIARTSATTASFKVYVIPGIYSESGFRSFYIDETGVVRGADKQGQSANENDLPIEN